MPQNPDNYFDQFEKDTDDYFSQFEHESIGEEPRMLPSHETPSVASRFGGGLIETAKEVAKDVNERGKKAAQHVREKNFPAAIGDIFGGFDPYSQLAGLGAKKLMGQDINLPPEQAKEVAKEQLLGLAGLPGKGAQEAYAQGDYARLGGQLTGAAATMGAFHYGGKTLESPVLERTPVKTEQKLLPRGAYTVDNIGQVYGGEQIPRISMRESLRGKPDIEAKPIKSEIIPKDILGEQPIQDRTARAYIDEVKAGRIDPKEVKFDDWKSQLPSQMKSESELERKTRLHQEYMDYTTSGFGAPINDEAARILRESMLHPGEIPPSTSIRERAAGGLSRHQYREFDDWFNEHLAREHGRSIENRPKYVAPSDWRKHYPSRMATEGENIFKVEAQMEDLGPAMASSLYQGDFPKIVTKELVQNSLDAVKSLGPNGRIDIDLQDPIPQKGKGGVYLKDAEGEDLVGNGFVRVRDNGPGMTLEELRTLFAKLGASGKRDDPTAIGGFGVAKAAPLLGGEKVEVVSRVMENGQLLEHSFSGTPDELLRGVSIATRKVGPEDFKGRPTLESTRGLSVGERLKLLARKEEPPDEFDSPTGLSVTSYYSPEFKKFGTYFAKKYIPEMVKNSMGYQGKIRVNDLVEGERIKYRTPQIHEVAPVIPGRSVTVNGPYADFDVIIPKDAQYGERQGTFAKILNNGMFQHQKEIWSPEGSIPNVPDKIIVNIRSKVPEKHKKYPFTLNRENIRDEIYAQITKYVNDNVFKPGISSVINATKEAYNRMPQINGVHYYDVGNRFTPEEFNSIVQHPFMKGLASDIQLITQDAMEVLNNAKWKEKLERIGILFDDKSRGIHIPNPGTNKSAILINPFSIAIKGDGTIRRPTETAAGLLHTILHEISHLEGGAHDENFAVRLADIYSQYGATNALISQETFSDFLTRGTGNYIPEVQELLSKYQESRRRPATIDDPLYRTGIKSRNQEFGGKGQIPSDPESSPIGADPTIEMMGGIGGVPPSSGGGNFDPSVNRLLRAIAEAKPRREEQEAIYSAERSRRFKEFMGVKTGGKKGAMQQLGKLKGEMERVEGIQLDDVDVDGLFNLVKRSNRITPGEKAKGYTALLKLMEGSEVPQRSELLVLDRVFGPGFGDQIIQMHGGIGALGVNIAKTANTMKTMETMLDASMTLYQGRGLMFDSFLPGPLNAIPTHPSLEFLRAFGSMFKYGASKKAFMGLEKYIEGHPNFNLWREADLYLADHRLGQHEEQFLNSYINDLSRLGNIGRKAEFKRTGKISEGGEKAYKAVDTIGSLLALPAEVSERVAVGFMNKLRFDTANRVLNNLVKAGYKPEDVAAQIARYINISSGRGSLNYKHIWSPWDIKRNPKTGEVIGFGSKLTEPLNIALFSPRLQTSRLTMLNPLYYIKAPDYMRKEAIRTALGIAGSIVLLDQLGKYGLGGQLQGNPLSSDFGKIQFGNVRQDPGAGFLQYITLFTRMLTNKTETSRDEIIDMSKGGYNSPNRWSLLFGDKERPGFIENKASPIATLISSFFRGKDFNGQPLKLNKEIRDRFTPLIIQDMRDVGNQDPSLLFPLGFPGLFGIPTQTYQPFPRKGQGLRMNTGMSLR